MINISTVATIDWSLHKVHFRTNMGSAGTWPILVGPEYTNRKQTSDITTEDILSA